MQKREAVEPRKVYSVRKPIWCLTSQAAYIISLSEI